MKCKIYFHLHTLSNREPLSYPLNLPAFYCKPTVLGLTKKKELSGKKARERD